MRILDVTTFDDDDFVFDDDDDFKGRDLTSDASANVEKNHKDVDCNDREGFLKCIQGAKDATNHTQMSKCLPDEILYDVKPAEFNELYWCWFGSDSLIEPKPNKDEKE